MPRPSLALFALALAACAGAESSSVEKVEPAPTPAASEAVPPEVPSIEPASTPEGLHNTLRWRTGPGSNLGYDVYRAEVENGPFTKINPKLVPGHGNRADRVHEFSYVDGEIEAGKTYWYYVEAVDLMGKRSRFTPVLRAESKSASTPVPAP
jgi:hypothetical protein